MKSPSSAQPDGGRPSALQEAAAAIEEEYRTSVKVRRLLCRRAEDVRDNREPWIVCLQVGSVGPWDWTFEGSTAFVPLPGDKPAAQALEDGEVVWRGEVVEVEPVKGLLYVALESVEEAAQVTPGVIWIRPFPFLWPLREIYQSPHLERYRELLPPLLEATLTGRLDRPERAPVGSDGLERVWAKPWGILWGPPGTGKTYRIGEQVADVLAKTDERVLVVSTTNRATDAVALSIGRALRRRGRPLDPVVRAGTGSHYGDYARTSMLELLAGTETAARQRFADLAKEIRQTTDPDRRARLQSDRALVRQQIENGSLSALLDPDKRVVVMTAAGASNVLGLEDVVQAIESGDLLFTTVILDEAGLLPRVSAAALSLFASWRTLLVGDPAQLAPISRIARVLPPRVARWIQMSALEHLDPSQEPPENVRLLTRQYRMHPAIRRVVSEYQYHGRLEDAGEVEERPAPFADALLTSSPRAVWIVFDEEPGELSHKRAERGPGQRSWIRRGTLPWLERLFGAIPELAKGPGLFLSPFVAQARAVDGWLARSGFTEWEASTVHAQQGTEARFVLFDTVNAGSHVWPTVEWKRLINVGLSRAREMAFLLATRQEMQEPYLAPLKSTLAPRVLEHRGSAWHWCSVPVVAPAPTLSTADRADSTLGRQIESRRALRPVLNREQERLCRLSLDGAGRVVRGVAGSGKTVILAHWLVQTLLNEPALGRLWVVYANEALKGLLGRTLLEVWEERQPGIAFPWERVTLWHVRHLLVDLHRRTGQEARFEFDYEKGAAELDRSRLQEALCDALFIDEAQDLGHVTLELLVSLVHSDPGSDQRRIVIFFDNAQNLYGRGTPTWSELGLDMRGRSTVLREGFRSTRPTAEVALNVLARLSDLEKDPDHRELVRRGSIVPVQRRGRPFYEVRFCPIDGPAPTLHLYLSRRAELRALGLRLIAWMTRQGVRPKDVCLLAPSGDVIEAAQEILVPLLHEKGIRLLVQRSEGFTDDEDVVTLTTPHSFKGYDAEIVFVLGVDRFHARGRGILASALYVALTRARSMLEISGLSDPPTADGQKIIDVVRGVLEDQVAPSDEFSEEKSRDLDELLGLIDEEHHRWLEKLADRYPMTALPEIALKGGSIWPLFRIDTSCGPFLFFDHLDRLVQDRDVLIELDGLGYGVLEPGDEPPE